MSDAPTPPAEVGDHLLTAEQSRDASIAALEIALRLTDTSVRWQAALRVLPDDAPLAMYRGMVARAVDADDAAREAVNLVRLALGGEALPDPAEPPAARPDEV